MKKLNLKIALKICFTSFVIGLFYGILSCFTLPNNFELIWNCLFLYLPLQSIIIFLIEKFISSKVNLYLTNFFLICYWFLIYKVEFTQQVANWSTFSKYEIIKVTLVDTFLSILISLIIFNFAYSKIKKQNKFKNN